MNELKAFISITYLTLILLLSSCFNSANKDSMVEIKMPEKGICAHRGAMNSHPENTIPSFLEAIRLGAHMIEFDVRLTKDGKLVILHDSSVDRTTNGKGEVNSLLLHEIKQLDCGSWKSQEFKDLKIPTLEETLSIMPKNIWLNIHLKGGEELGRKTAKAIIETKREHQSVVACGKESATGAKSVSSKIMICNMERQDDRENYISETIENKNEFIQLLKRRDSPYLEKEINLLKENKIKINYYGSDSEIEIQELFQSGVDFILVNELSAMLTAAEKIGIKRQVH